MVGEMCLVATSILLMCSNVTSDEGMIMQGLNSYFIYLGMPSMFQYSYDYKTICINPNNTQEGIKQIATIIEKEKIRLAKDREFYAKNRKSA